MSKTPLYSVGFRNIGGSTTEKRGVDFVEAINLFAAFKATGLNDVWIYYDPFPDFG